MWLILTGVVSWFMKNLMVVAIAAGVLLASNAITGWVWYVKGYNSAASVCKLNTVIREREEARRDLKLANDTGATLKAELERQRKALATSDGKVTEYAAELAKKIDALDAAERKAAATRPATCPACPRPRACVVD